MLRRFREAEVENVECIQLAKGTDFISLKFSDERKL
jgi:hypothetical protein